MLKTLTMNSLPEVVTENVAAVTVNAIDLTIDNTSRKDKILSDAM
jgi:hypothetical protein